MDDRMWDKIADVETDRFLRRCAAEGRMTQTEYDELRLDHYSAGTKPEWVELPKEMGDAIFQLLGVASIETTIYLNSETMSQLEIAKRLQVSRGFVREALEHMYSVLPELRDRAGNGNAIPALRKMCQLREDMGIRHTF